MFTSTHPTADAIDAVVRCLEPRVTTAMNETLYQPFTSDEITRALKHMHPLKSPGPNEAFSGLIHQAESEGVIRGVAIARSAIPASHLLFADNTLIFCQASEEALSRLQIVLADFEATSGHSSVLNTILKHKYFPNNSFFGSRLGASPSYTWKSLWGARDVLAAGMRWRVGDGSSIMIIGHPWIPRFDSFQPICRPVSLPPDSRVASLLTNNKDWNIDLIKKEFFPIDTDIILDIKLGRTAECSSNAQQWDFIWSSKAPLRVILFAWRCALDALPTTSHLKSQGVRLSVVCGSCGLDTEDLLHVLLTCSLARLVWAVSGLPWGSINCIQSNTEWWLREVHRRIGRRDWDLFLTICWSIWKARNQHLFEGAPLDALDIVRQATHVMNNTQSSYGNADSLALVM
ncbi:UNVERIFIED_CONTAM: hypothetical protein Slati_3498300 [Sesamum latifolium]|uniref:Reverse transcriptase zinc-binding domain-containing protein n=1 Tax=Sesamum latifolium TaxID=2727402 RepID=A0AAW2UH80_9LAMI